MTGYATTYECTPEPRSGVGADFRILPTHTFSGCRHRRSLATHTFRVAVTVALYLHKLFRAAVTVAVAFWVNKLFGWPGFWISPTHTFGAIPTQT